MKNIIMPDHNTNSSDFVLEEYQVNLIELKGIVGWPKE